jgi:hypothetical protein
MIAALAADMASGGKSSRLVLTTYSAIFFVTSTALLPVPTASNLAGSMPQ